MKTLSEKDTIKQRIIKLMEEGANKQFFDETKLTNEEFEMLRDSFISKEEVEIYNEYTNTYEQLSQAFSHLNQLRLSYHNLISKLNGYCLLIESYEKIEKLTNIILKHITNLEERKKILADILNEDLFPLTKTYLNSKGMLEIIMDFQEIGKNQTNFQKEILLKTIINNLSKQAESTLSDLKILTRAIHDYMKEKKFNIKPFKKLLQNVIADISEDKAVLSRYSSAKAKKNPTKNSYPVYPDFNQLPIEEENYQKFKHAYFYE